jgi:hypothetical protein
MKVCFKSVVPLLIRKTGGGFLLAVTCAEVVEIQEKDPLRLRQALNSS